MMDKDSKELDQEVTYAIVVQDNYVTYKRYIDNILMQFVKSARVNEDINIVWGITSIIKVIVW